VRQQHREREQKEKQDRERLLAAQDQVEHLSELLQKREEAILQQQKQQEEDFARMVEQMEERMREAVRKEEQSKEALQQELMDLLRRKDEEIKAAAGEEMVCASWGRAVAFSSHTPSALTLLLAPSMRARMMLNHPDGLAIRGWHDADEIWAQSQKLELEREALQRDFQARLEQTERQHKESAAKHKEEMRAMEAEQKRAVEALQAQLEQQQQAQAALEAVKKQEEADKKERAEARAKEEAAAAAAKQMDAEFFDFKWDESIGKSLCVSCAGLVVSRKEKGWVRADRSVEPGSKAKWVIKVRPQATVFPPVVCVAAVYDVF